MRFANHANGTNASIKSNFHYTRGITPKRVTSGGAHLRALATQLRKKGRNYGEQLATLYPIQPPRNRTPDPPHL